MVLGWCCKFTNLQQARKEMWQAVQTIIWRGILAALIVLLPIISI